MSEWSENNVSLSDKSIFVWNFFCQMSCFWFQFSLSGLLLLKIRKHLWLRVWRKNFSLSFRWLQIFLFFMSKSLIKNFFIQFYIRLFFKNATFSTPRMQKYLQIIVCAFRRQNFEIRHLGLEKIFLKKAACNCRLDFSMDFFISNFPFRENKLSYYCQTI